MNVSVTVLAEELIPPIEVDPNLVTPGVIGFAVTVVVSVAVLLLLVDMVRRIRRVRYRAEIAEELDREMLNQQAD